MAELYGNVVSGKDLGSETMSISRAQIRDYFFEQNTAEIQKLLIKDLRKYVDSADISRMKLITLDFFVPSFLEKLCNVYDVNPVFKFEESLKDSQDAEKFFGLMEEVQINRVFQENFLKSRLHNTILSNVKYNADLDRVFVNNNLNKGNSNVISYPGFVTEPMFVYWEEPTFSGDKIFVVWDRKYNLHYYSLKEPELTFKADGHKVDVEKYPVGNNEDLTAPPFFPFVTYRYKEHNGQFWGYGLDSVIELVRSINILLSVSNDDTIQETIRLLILNFDPTGVEGERGQLKTGLRHPLFVENAIGTREPSGEILSATLYNDDVIKLIENLTDMVSRMHNVDNVLKQNLEKNLSGISLRLRNEPLMRQWAKDISILRAYDKELVQRIVEVNNYYRDNNQINPNLLNEMSIDYQEPRIVTDEKDDYQLEKLKWEDGTSSPIEYVKKRNPEYSDEQAKEYISQNLSDYNDLFSIDFSTGNINPEDVEDIE